jgi:chromosome segregation ATPase
MSNPIADRKRRRLEAKPPTYNEDCAGCKERAFDIMKAMDAIDENIDTVEEIYDLLDVANDTIVKLQTKVGNLEDMVVESNKRLKEAETDLNDIKEFIKFLKKIRKIVAAAFAVATFIFGLLGALPNKFWEWILSKIVGGGN